jgi:hypothetical protein
MVDVGERAVSVVTALLRRHADIQYLRFRSYPAPAKEQDIETPLTIERALRHKRAPEILWAVPESRTFESLTETLTKMSSDKILVGICSRIELRSGRAAHALLMDFRRAEKSREFLQRIEEACQQIGYTGWLLETSGSYHFYGDDLVDLEEWVSFMSTWLLLEDLVDVRFIGHCLIERVSCLRLTGNAIWSEPKLARHIDSVHSKPRWLGQDGVRSRT